MTSICSTKRHSCRGRTWLALGLLSLSSLAHALQPNALNANPINPGFINQVVADGIKHMNDERSSSPHDVVTKVRLEGDGASSAAELATRFPSAQRDRMQKAYVQSLAAWLQLADKLGVEGADIGSATAAFIAGNWMVSTGQALPDAHFKVLALQMQRYLSAHEPWKAVSATDKRKMVEQLAMVGTFMALAQSSLQQHPDANAEANLKHAARENLAQLLNVPADRVHIGAEGLRLD